MAFIWLSSLRNPNNQTINFIVPSWEYVRTAPTSHTIAANPYSSVAETAAAIYAHDYVLGSTPTPSFLAPANVGTYDFDVIGARLRFDTMKDGSIPRNKTKTIVRDFNGVVYETTYRSGCIYDTSYSDYTYDEQSFGPCCVIDSDTQQMYFGVCDTVHYSRGVDNWYTTHIYMYDYDYQNVWNYFKDYIPSGGGSDPYAGGGYSTQDGGGGGFDDTSDIIALPSTPNLNLSLNHFISAYVPSISDINDLADWIWGNYDKFDATKVLGKIFTEPMESILSLHMLPFTPASSTAIAVTIGNFATGLTMKPMTLQFTDIDCGSLTFDEYWGNYLDYNPYTKIVLCLPFVGQVDLDADEVMGKEVSVKYRVDNLTGAFVCFVYIDGDKILGQYSGECMLQVPVTAGSYAAMNAAIATIACTAAASFGGATAAAIGGGYGGMIGVEKGLQMGGQALGETLASGAANVNGMKLQVSHSGALTGTAGFLGVMKPYAIIHRPRQCVPEHYNEMAGYPSNITKTLGDCTGFTSVRTMVYDGLPFTDGEILALDSILKGGIFI